ncbi:hypothetical protein EV421DRAFT_1736322 [Armillaria borealis]|uniref:Uncharacterized protein n=1 Tax=Armillaria borealis TaxID=47425 RepID=A0AA39JH70_9AGAR|nr:hypothetical protein EV421DRAFT_1736322 [Armillaria borealis]
MPPSRTKKVAATKKSTKREPSVLVISSDDERSSFVFHTSSFLFPSFSDALDFIFLCPISSPSKNVASPEESSTSRILSVLGDGRELALAPTLDDDEVGASSSANITEGAAVAAIPAKSRKKSSAIVQPGSPSYAAVVSGMPAASPEPSPEPSPVKAKAASLPSGSNLAKSSKSSRIANVLGVALGPGVILKALKALDVAVARRNPARLG